MKYDWYMADIMAECNNHERWNERIRSLKVSEEFVVANNCERKCVLKRASRMGVTVSTAKLKSGGYVIKRIPNAPPRRPGQPAKWGKLDDLINWEAKPKEANDPPMSGM